MKRFQPKPLPKKAAVSQPKGVKPVVTMIKNEWNRLDVTGLTLSEWDRHFCRSGDKVSLNRIRTVLKTTGLAEQKVVDEIFSLLFNLNSEAVLKEVSKSLDQLSFNRTRALVSLLLADRRFQTLRKEVLYTFDTVIWAVDSLRGYRPQEEDKYFKLRLEGEILQHEIAWTYHTCGTENLFNHWFESRRTIDETFSERTSNWLDQVNKETSNTFIPTLKSLVSRLKLLSDRNKAFFQYFNDNYLQPIEVPIVTYSRMSPRILEALTRCIKETPNIEALLSDFSEELDLISNQRAIKEGELILNSNLSDLDLVYAIADWADRYRDLIPRSVRLRLSEQALCF